MLRTIPELPGYIAESTGSIYRYSLTNCGEISLLKLTAHRIGDAPFLYIFLRDIEGNLVHRAVDKIIAELFLDNPKGYTILRHANGNACDNSVVNLDWAPFRKCRLCRDFGRQCNNYAKCVVGKPMTKGQAMREELRMLAMRVNINELHGQRKVIILGFRDGLTPIEIQHRLQCQNENWGHNPQYIYRVRRELLNRFANTQLW